MGEFKQWLNKSEVDAYTNPYDAARIAWIHQQSKIEQLERKLNQIKHYAKGLRNEFNLWSDDGEGSDAIEAQIELLEEALRGECD